ncbi:hypothetical protein PA598K_04379 [Paenibacillus sp. 598K]|uniref:hypothetical protein n=1 Tax=Paenibacillus sp. 598K TaxID=1117987 RepID=UPI000FFA4D49|nr:hypothetical protein [Paenibacillus sp. 598K]GBF75943.1 hypothetical protein PA598K_04379 [Paenibacillus sp. 598K]
MSRMKGEDPVYPVSYDEAVLQLLRSIVVENESLSQLIRSQSEKTIAFTGRKLDFPTNPTTSEIIAYNQTFISLLDNVLMSKWMVMKKMDVLLQLKPQETSLDVDNELDLLDDRSDPHLDY